MSVVQKAEISTRHRQRLDRQGTASKRKLDEYEPLASGGGGGAAKTPVRMRLLDPSPSDPSPSCLHFFVRTTSRTLVVHALPDDTVESVSEQIRLLTGIATSEQRLIYCGRQLQTDSTLADCAIETDACLHLTGRLRSTKFPRAWQIVNDLISAVCWLGCDGTTAGPHARAGRERSVDSLLKEFLSRTPTATGNGESESDTWGHLQVFIVAGAPAVLVKLYLSKATANRALAESAVRIFLNSNSEFLTSYIHNHCSSIVLAFCKLLVATVGKTDPLYQACRSTFASLLHASDSRFFIHTRTSSAVISDLFPFVSELAGTLIEGLTFTSVVVPHYIVSPAFILEFSSFLRGIRRAVQEWLGGKSPIPEDLLHNTHPRYEHWIGSLYLIFKELLTKTEESLVRIEYFLRQSGVVPGESLWVVWSQLLIVLTELKTFSKIYHDGRPLLHSVLVAQKFPLNALLRRARRSDSLRWFLKYKDVTDFESRLNLVLMLFPEGKDDYEELHEMLIDRSQLLAESFEYIGQAEAGALHGGLFMEFKNEEATGPGVLREWFCLLCRAIFNPQNVLFVPCPNDRRRFFPNHASAVDPLHLKYFVFCGRVMALALMHKVQVGVVFDRVFFLQLAGRIITLEDIQDADPFLYTSCKKILEMDANLLDSDVLGLTFVREIEELGAQRAVELCPGGKDIVVNSKNRAEYVNLLIEHRFVISISEQVSHFAQGFSDILSNSKLKKLFFESLDVEDFDKMLGGNDNIINVKEWTAHTEYNGYKATDRQISWFWKIVEGMPAEQKRVLLFFWTSVKYLPVNGFGGLASKLYIYKSSDSHDRLPTSHTCFYRLCLPPYPSMPIMRDRLQLITQEHVSCTFGIW